MLLYWEQLFRDENEEETEGISRGVQIYGKQIEHCK